MEDFSIELITLLEMEEAIYGFGKKKVNGYDYFLSQEIIVQRSRN